MRPLKVTELPLKMKKSQIKSHFPIFGLMLLCVTQVVVGDDHRFVAAGCFMGALIIWVSLVRSTDKSDFQGIDSRILIFTVALLAVLMVVIPPATSKDFNSYALYGQMTAEYGVSPYVHVPRDIATDPWFERTSFYWSDTPSVYGWLFTTASTAVMDIAGTSVGMARAGFALLALAGLGMAMTLLAHRRGWNRAALLVGLNPLILTFGVNDLHCDVLVGSFVLAAVLAIEQPQRKSLLKAGLAGVGLACAVGVKIAALPAVGGAFIWLVFRRRWTQAAVLSGSFGAVSLAGFWLAGGLEALAPITDAAGRQTRFSIWNPIASWLTDWLGAAPPTLGLADAVVSMGATLVVAIVGLGLIWRYRHHSAPVFAIVAGLVTYQLLGAYVLSWYALWALPALALVHRSRLAMIAMAHGAWIAIAYLSGWLGLAVAVVGIGWLALMILRTKRSLPHRVTVESS